MTLLASARAFTLASLSLMVSGLALAQTPIKIGEINSYSAIPQFTQPYKQGWQLAVEQINAQGGLLGRQVEVIARDDAGKPEEALRHAIEERVREQGGRLVGWALGASIAKRALAVINAELDKIEPDGSELRDAFDEWMRREIARIEADPARAAELGAAVRSVLGHDSVKTWFWDVWSRLRLALEADAARPNGRTVAFLAEALGNLGEMLRTDPAAHARLQRAAEGVASGFLPAAQAQLADFIAEVVDRWDSATLVERLELRLGPDLQYVRINGTLVGFLVGGVVYLALNAIFGHVRF